jgi:hypothetical protein
VLGGIYYVKGEFNFLILEKGVYQLHGSDKVSKKSFGFINLEENMIKVMS